MVNIIIFFIICIAAGFMTSISAFDYSYMSDKDLMPKSPDAFQFIDVLEKCNSSQKYKIQQLIDKLRNLETENNYLQGMLVASENNYGFIITYALPFSIIAANYFAFGFKPIALFGGIAVWLISFILFGIIESRRPGELNRDKYEDIDIERVNYTIDDDLSEAEQFIARWNAEYERSIRFVNYRKQVVEEYINTKNNMIMYSLLVFLISCAILFCSILGIEI